MPPTTTSLPISPNGVTELHTDTNHTFLPGEPVLLLAPGSIVTLGNGLKPNGHGTVKGITGDIITAAVSGPLVKSVRSNRPGMPIKYSVESATARKYIPHKGDPVIGVIMRVTAQTYILHINAAHLASLDVLAFDGASKTNRPKFRVGDVLYCHVLSADPQIETEVSCAAVGGTAKDWSSGESLFGGLRGGTIARVPLIYAADVLNGAPVLGLLGERVAFECASGMNGCIWVRAAQGKCGLDNSGGGDPYASESAINNITSAVGDGGLAKTIAIAECVRESQHDVDRAAVTRRVVRYFPYHEV